MVELFFPNIYKYSVASDSNKLDCTGLAMHVQIGVCLGYTLIQRVAKHFWFPRIRKYVKKYKAVCVECCFNKRKAGKPEVEVYIIEGNAVPFQTIKYRLSVAERDTFTYLL